MLPFGLPWTCQCIENASFTEEARVLFNHWTSPCSRQSAWERIHRQLSQLRNILRKVINQGDVLRLCPYHRISIRL